jgi:uncharacterized iron-regulated membrane protein
MLLLCLTGLPLIFHHELDHLLGNEVEAPVLSAEAGSRRADLDGVLAAAMARHHGRIVQFASQEEDSDALWFVTLTPTPEPTADFKSIAVDARTGVVLGEPPTDTGFMYVMLALHVDLFAGQPGKLFLGFMGLLMLVAIVSGVVLYAPFMRKLDFGTVRHARAPRLKWLDLHNLLGAVTMVWAFVVAGTGMVNTWAELVVTHWQEDQLTTLLAPYKGRTLVPDADRAPVQRTLDAALAHSPGRKLAFIAFPGTLFSSPHHNTFFLRGDTPLTSRLLQPVLVDARTAEVTAAPALPWYLSALLISQPLHFGDYAGMPMKILWALLDVATIVVLCSGLYLWWQRRPSRQGAPRGAGGAPGAADARNVRGGRATVAPGRIAK